MSLLGRLLSTASCAQSNALDSNLEDQFTYNLLFPDREALCHKDQVFQLKSGTTIDHSFVSNFDLNNELDLELRDVRVIIMQEATPLSGSAYLLYDSHALPPSPLITEDPIHPEDYSSSSSPRKSSVDHTSRSLVPPENSRAQAFGAFDRRSQQSKNFNYSRMDLQRSTREYREEVTSFSHCIFGNSDILAYKGTGTKVHILPSETRTSYTSSSYAGDGNGSFGRSCLRNSRLSYSFTSDSVQPSLSVGISSPNTIAKSSEKVKVLITRMFPVPIPQDDLTHVAPTPQNSQASNIAGPQLPHGGVHGEFPDENRNWLLKQKKTPMYAVGLVIHLPLHPSSCAAPTSRSSIRGPGSLTDHDSFSSSFNSTRRYGWTPFGHGHSIESMDSSIYSDVDGRIDIVAQNWDIITRNLSHLQTVATSTILSMLRQVLLGSLDPVKERKYMRASSSRISDTGRRVFEDSRSFKMPTSNSKMIQLSANCLMRVEKIQKVVESSRKRIVIGIKAQNVIAGQGRWGIWRDQARIINKWAVKKDQGVFFYNLLNAFLGNHTQWLQALGPSWYRRQYHQQHKAGEKDNTNTMDRTVIVSNDKVIARRLVFLLSSFLPSNRQNTPTRFHRPSTSLSLSTYSNSPPKHAIPIMREDSLRRRLNRRAGAVKFEHSRTPSFQFKKDREIGSSSSENQLDLVSIDSAAPARTAHFPIPGSDLGVRKSTTVTASTAIPITTKPHFSTARCTYKGTGPMALPESSGSLAADDLLRLNRRVSTAGLETSSQTPGWGSMISGFWSSSKRVYSGSSVHMPVSPVPNPDIQVTHDKIGARAVRREPAEANHNQNLRLNKHFDCHMESAELAGTTLAKTEDRSAEVASEQVAPITHRIPDPSGAYESPVKTSINKEDGVIDIDVPLPDYLDFEPAVSSPSSTGYLLTPDFGNCMEFFEQYFRACSDIDMSMNVGGWLPHYSPDFTVQAVPGHKKLVEEIKASLQAEKTPSLVKFSVDTWVDVGSVIIVDTINFTIKRILYQRLIRATDASNASPEISDSWYKKVNLSSHQPASAEEKIKDRFIEEPIKSIDEKLTGAVERIIAQSGDANIPPPECSSKSVSSKKGHLNRSNSDAHKQNYIWPSLEVPRNECQRMVLGALEDIVKAVAESRNDSGNAKERESFLRGKVRNWLSKVENNE